MRLIFYFLIIAELLLSASAHASTLINPVGCENNQSRRSVELLQLAADDQADRNQAYASTDWNKVNERDLKRRIRVGEIFGEGCFKEASDYASAAMIYQHGVTADHYYQAFIWANQAVKLGQNSQRWLAAASLDRYLEPVRS